MIESGPRADIFPPIGQTATPAGLRVIVRWTPSLWLDKEQAVWGRATVPEVVCGRER
jgi:hypothetical protein